MGIVLSRRHPWLTRGTNTFVDGSFGHCWVLASVDLPVETFIVEANVNILTSLLFLKKKTREEIQSEDLGRTVDYPVFMAVAEKVGFDRRGVPLYERTPDR